MQEVGISTQGTIVSIREDSGIIYRCPECRRVLRDGECAIHGLRMEIWMLDCVWFLTMVNRRFPYCQQICNRNIAWNEQADISSNVSENGSMQFIQDLRERLLGRELLANGRTIVDEQGAMLLSDDVELIETDSVLAASELRSKWGWFDCSLLEELEDNQRGQC